MGSLPRAGRLLKGFILFNIDDEDFAMDIKIVHAILKTENYKHFISPLYRHVNSTIEYVSDRTNSQNRIILIPDKNKPKEMNYYLCS
jgi:hypothetical protein